MTIKLIFPSGCSPWMQVPINFPLKRPCVETAMFRKVIAAFAGRCIYHDYWLYWM